ncbi:hypothetical protein SOCEGT47_055450 [Sorangium cellulosum]|uniref:Secreted protein n=2 Tax=Sorangium cellulosum TaxID=56 RepID=A0A4P2Q6A9_SORCE|nr:hypothetical protein SOCEGT47_055450 [Sorangium cellulosum]
MIMKKRRAGTALAVAALGSVAGCWTAGKIMLSTDEDPYPGLDLYGSIDPCVTAPPPPGFGDPILFWMGSPGDEASVPECPKEAPERVFDGYGGFDRAHACPPCRCSGPSCELPRALEGSSSAACDGPGSMSFDAPAGWDGACAAPAAAAPGEIGSLRIPAPTVSACEVVDERAGEPRDLPAPWGERARGCAGVEGERADSDLDATCVAWLASRHPDFTVCIHYLGEGAPRCPAAYPEMRTFFRGFDDTRGCTRCECGPAHGSRCVALVSAYEDRSCGRVLDAVTVTLAGPKCVTGPGLRLASLDAQWIEDEPGSCAARGGVPTGDVRPRGESFFCCQSDEAVFIR